MSSGRGSCFSRFKLKGDLILLQSSHPEFKLKLSSKTKTPECQRVYTWEGGSLLQYILQTTGHGEDAILFRICYTCDKVIGSEWDMLTHEIMCQEATRSSPRFKVFELVRGLSE